MSEPDRLKFLRKWNLVSAAMLVIGLLIAVPSGLCVGQAAYDFYASTSAYDSGYAQALFIGGVLIFGLGALVILGAFRSRLGPDDE